MLLGVNSIFSGISVDVWDLVCIITIIINFVCIFTIIINFFIVKTIYLICFFGVWGQTRINKAVHVRGKILKKNKLVIHSH